ncbi:MAG TPA: hypothetical protein VGM88_30055 [Kofleriaceae bacterium]|jgi:hypothetical protein
MRDEQVRRYARHILLPDVGGLGQTALLVAAAKLELREAEPLAELIAATYLGAGGVGTIVLPHATEAQRADVAAHAPDSHVVSVEPPVEGRPGPKPVALAATPPWWPGAAGDATALAFWRGGIAATAWMADATQR